MANESLTLDGLNLFASPFFMESINFGLPTALAEWVKGADSNGAILGRPPLYENRVIEARVSVQQQATMTLALAQIATLEDKLLECAQNANGLALVWTPADTATSITFRCLLGEIVDLPVSWESRYFAKAPEFGIRLTCLPFGEGAAYLAGTATSSDPIVSVEVEDVPGDVPALGRLVVTDAASQSRRYVAWGLESRHYVDTTSLIMDSTSMVTSGFAGTTATRTGAYSGASNNVISATVFPTSQAICGLGNLGHVGSYRPHLRFYASATTMAVRLTFQALDGPARSLSYRVPVAVGWNFVDLGLVSIPESSLGTQRWTGRIEAYSTATGGETFEVDVVLLVPAEAFGRTRGKHVHEAGVLGAADDFAAMTTGASLNATTAQQGGTWATSGATTDFVATDPTASRTIGAAMTRSTASDSLPGRMAILGSATYTNSEVGVRFYVPASAVGVTGGVIARYVDNNNFLRGDLSSTGVTATDYTLNIVRYVAGVATTMASEVVAVTTGWYQLRLVAFASGLARLTLMTAAGTEVVSAMASHTTIATSGTLASGKAGFADHAAGVGTATRYYDSFYAATPTAEPVAIYSGQSLEVRHDTTLREDSTGTYAGLPPEYVGSRFYVPNAGGEGRKSRVGVVARRHDAHSLADDNIADSTTVDVFVTPRYLAVPRA